MIENLQQMPQHQRVQILQDNADKVEQTTYQKPLTPEEMDMKREQLTDNAIKLSEYEDELTEVKDLFKEKMKPLATANKALLTQIKTKQETAEGTLYHIANHETKFMETYDQAGQLIGTRRLRPEERQAKIFSIAQKTA